MKNLASMVTRQNVINALEKALVEKPKLIRSTKYLLIYKNQNFPPKEVIRLAAKERGIKEKDFSKYSLQGGPPTNTYLEKMGFGIIQFADWKLKSSNSEKNRTFVFQAGKSSKNLNTRVFTKESKLVQSFPLHDKIQNILYKHLLIEYGKTNVGMETNTGNNTRIDISVKTKDGITLYEVKSYDEPLISIRNAIGQLLEYAFYPNPIENLNELVIVSHLSLNKNEMEYLEILRRRLGLKVFYMHVDIKNRTVSHKI